MGKTEGQAVAGFGPSMIEKVPHRMWEISIPLVEIGASSGRLIHFGIRNASASFDDQEPPNFMQDFSALSEIILSSNPPRPAQSEAASSPRDEGVRRTIGADGSVEIHYPDGRVKIPYQCGYTMKFPNGSSQTIACATQAQPGDDAAVAEQSPEHPVAQESECQKN